MADGRRKVRVPLLDRPSRRDLMEMGLVSFLSGDVICCRFAGFAGDHVSSASRG